MMRSRTRNRDLAHEHEWDEEPTEIFEDGAWMVWQDCWWEEVTGSYTDHERDETYYETGYECDAERLTRLDASRVEEVGHGVVDEGEGLFVQSDNNVPQALAEALCVKIADELTDGRRVVAEEGSDVSIRCRENDWTEYEAVEVQVTLDEGDLDGWADTNLAGTYRVEFADKEVTVHE